MYCSYPGYSASTGRQAGDSVSVREMGLWGRPPPLGGIK